jgi:putative nucleotidyltransferase with HDIG domain
MTRDQALAILHEFVSSDSLRKHALAVEAVMRYYARQSGQDEDLWGAVGLLHDFDYEKYPQPPQHTTAGAEILRQRGVDETIVGAILSHADWNQDRYPLDTPLRKTLYACDELTGFVVACALVRPTRLEGMTASSVTKKMKQPSFAAAVSREEIRRGAEILGIDLNQHIANIIDALKPAANDLGLSPSAG